MGESKGVLLYAPACRTDMQEHITYMSKASGSRLLWGINVYPLSSSHISSGNICSSVPVAYDDLSKPLSTEDVPPFSKAPAAETVLAPGFSCLL